MFLSGYGIKHLTLILTKQINWFQISIIILFLVFKRHFQQYFSYIMAISLLVREAGENHRPLVSNW